MTKIPLRSNAVKTSLDKGSAIIIEKGHIPVYIERVYKGKNHEKDSRI